MINENIKPSNDFAVPYYAYTELSGISVPAFSYVNKTLTFSSGIDWGNIVITAEFQINGATTNIVPQSETLAYVTVVNHTSSAIVGILRVRALLSVPNVTMTLS